MREGVSPSWVRPVVRYAHTVEAHAEASLAPAAFAAVGAGAMILIAIPFFSMRLGSADAGTDPAGSTTRL